MALDFCILNRHGVVEHKIPIGMDDFCFLKEKALQLPYDTLLNIKLVDFYSDCEFFINELQVFQNELENILKNIPENSHDFVLVKKICLLCEFAKLSNTTIVVLAD